MNKQLKRFLCFFMVFCLAFAWFGEPIEARAVGLEAAIATLIIWMASFGFSFVAAQSTTVLRDAIEGWAEEFVSSVEELQDMTIDDWLAAIAADVIVNNSGYIAVGATAAELMTKFMNWLELENGVIPGYSLDLSSSYTQVLLQTGAPYYINGVVSDIYLVSFYNYQISTAVNYSNQLVVNSPTVLIPGDYISPVSDVSSTRLVVNDDFTLSNVSSSGTNVVDYPSYFDDYGYSTADCLGYVPVVCRVGVGTSYERVALVPFFSDGRILFVRSLVSYSALSIAVSAISCISSEVNDTVVMSVDDSGLDYPDPSTWPVGFAGYVLNTGDLTFSSEADVDSVVDNAILTGELDVIPELTIEETPPITSDGTLEGDVSAIFQSIAALPQTLANLVLDGIKNIFVPDPDEMNAQFMGLLDEINEKYAFDFDLEGLFSGEKEPDDITAHYTVGALSWDVTFVSWYYLKKGVEFFRPYIRGFIVLMLVFFQLRQFMAVLNMFSLESGSGGAAPSGSSTSLVVQNSGGVVKR